jgi:hypothetical protein
MSGSQPFIEFYTFIFDVLISMRGMSYGFFSTISWANVLLTAISTSSPSLARTL